MAVRVLRSLPFGQFYIELKIFSSKPIFPRNSLGDIICKVLVQEPVVGRLFASKQCPFNGHRWIHSAPCLTMADKVVNPSKPPEHNAKVDASGSGKVKRKRPKGKRAVIKWLKFLRWKKKRESQRLTAEEKIVYKLNKARKKKEQLVQALKKIEPADSSELIHDPEILTSEEHFFFLKMGLKCKNYVPVGRRGIYQGVILNMHLHWKKHQTLQVVVKTFPPEEVKEIAAELARLTGGIVLDIHKEDTIIMYRGKNYVQPPTEIMSPRVLLPRKKAMDKSKYIEGLRAVRKYIPKLEQDIELLRAQAKSKPESKTIAIEGTQTDSESTKAILNLQHENSEKGKEIMDRKKECSEEDDVVTERGFSSDLSDMYEIDSEMETEKKVERPLYLEEFEKFPVKGNGGSGTKDFEDHLRQISVDSKEANSLSEDMDLSNFDEVDRLFLRAASLLKKRRR